MNQNTIKTNSLENQNTIKNRKTVTDLLMRFKKLKAKRVAFYSAGDEVLVEQALQSLLPISAQQLAVAAVSFDSINSRVDNFLDLEWIRLPVDTDDKNQEAELQTLLNKKNAQGTILLLNAGSIIKAEPETTESSLKDKMRKTCEAAVLITDNKGLSLELVKQVEAKVAHGSLNLIGLLAVERLN